MDAKQDHERMCAAFDEWVADDNTHWLSEHDAAYQGFMAAWEMRSDEMARQNQATRYTNDLFDQMNDERKRQGAEIERLRKTTRLAERCARAKGRYHQQHVHCDLMEHFGVPCVRPGEEAGMVRCACGDMFPPDSFGAGFIEAKGFCENCDMMNGGSDD